MSIINKMKNSLCGIANSARAIAEKNNRNRMVVAADIIYCMIKYSASPNNYEKFEFFKLSGKQRSTYVTYGISQKMIKKFNNPADIDIFENKLKFAEVFSDMFGRDYLSVSDMTLDVFERFCEGKEKVICKPYGGSQGKGIKVLYLNGDIKQLFDEIKSDYAEGYMLEEWIMQHPELNAIYPDAVNCLRVITVFDGEKTHFITGGVTFGISTEIANGSQPSIVAPLDFETGVFSKPAASFGTDLYENHPVTGGQITGVSLPFWKETKIMLEQACMRVPSVGYIGWDVAITPNGPVLIEGNTTPGYKYYQIPKHLENGTGNRAKYEKYL